MTPPNRAEVGSAALALAELRRRGYTFESAVLRVRFHDPGGETFVVEGKDMAEALANAIQAI